MLHLLFCCKIDIFIIQGSNEKYDIFIINGSEDKYHMIILQTQILKSWVIIFALIIYMPPFLYNKIWKD
jgi:hypothetical protein